ncbi:MAG TPA: hypothetical protein VEL07_06855 [Planctomycetota bacterium]|nr:hypothetical protein [Planctomycetota bacterium]
MSSVQGFVVSATPTKNPLALNMLPTPAYVQLWDASNTVRVRQRANGVLVNRFWFAGVFTGSYWVRCYYDPAAPALFASAPVNVQFSDPVITLNIP